MEKVESYLLSLVQKASGPDEISARVHKVTLLAVLYPCSKKALCKVCERLLAWNSPHIETISNSFTREIEY